MTKFVSSSGKRVINQMAPQIATKYGIKYLSPYADEGFGFRAGTAAQGLGGAVNVYQGLNNIDDDKLGGGLQTAQGAAQIGAALGNETAASILPYAGYAKGGLGAYRALTGKGVPDDMRATMAQQQIGLAVADAYTGGLASLANAGLRKFKPTAKLMTGLDKLDQKFNPLTVAINHTNVFGGKGKDQMARDSVRKFLKQKGVLDDDYNLTLTDGTKFNIGKDGGYKDENGLRAYELNMGANAPKGQGDVIGLVNPLAEILVGGDDKLRSAYAGYLTKAAMKSGDARANVQGFFKGLGVDRDIALKQLQALKEGGKLTDEELAAYTGGLNSLFGGGVQQQRNGATSSGTRAGKGKGRGKTKKPRIPTVDAPIADPLPSDSDQAQAPAFDLDAYNRALADIFNRNRYVPTGDLKQNPYFR